jgi:hypothetical protein
MTQTLAEFFPEDMKQFDNIQAEQTMIDQYKKDMSG